MDIAERVKIIAGLTDVQVEIVSTKTQLRSAGMFTRVVDQYCILHVGNGHYELFHYEEIAEIRIIFV